MNSSSPPIGLSGTNLVRAADHNQRVTLHAIRVNGSLTRVDLAQITGLTAAAIANITRRLLADGLIQEAGRRFGGRGQPPTNLIINRDACYSLGLNIDRDHVTLVLVDFLGQTVARASREIEFALPDQVAAFYREQAPAMLAAAGVEPARIVGLGVATPDDLGRIELPGKPDAYARWNTIDLAELLAEPIDVPVFVENDAAAAAMGELQLGQGLRRSSFFYILISSALGGGLVIDSNYFRGATGRSGELGFLTRRDPDGVVRQIQAHVSLSGLAAPLEAAGHSLQAMLEGDGRDPAIETVVDAWIEQAAELLVEPLIAVNCLINPEAVLIGGRLPARHVDRLAERTAALLAERGRHAPSLAPITRAQLSADAPAVGAAILPFSYFLLPKRSALWTASATSSAA
ncbi:MULTISPECIES: ROK family transcriptional regulator [unclassified Sphingomonas]|uniref:ROK family transcriptional regulator n=1 Tax=unclassified Sphingomonas TaxID=196159 RepID=UPI0002DDAA8E|nr:MULTISPECIES: ROK family transcriptional regulator [unclassified Sphingomonas]KTF68751.1 ROK family transcriptional regulator [Sphingomonas sp. WG]